MAFAAAVLATQGVAAGALSGVSASLATQSGGTGAQSVSTPPGGVLSARVIANATGSSKWRATSWQIGPNGACADHSDQSGSGKSATFNVTAPGTPGDYGATFTPRGENNCSGEQGTPVTLVNGVRVSAPAPNPNLKSQCGLNVMLILDKSGSIASSGATEQVRAAARAFLTSLSGTGSRVSIIDFSTSASRPIDYTTVTPQTIANVFNPYLVNQYKPSGWTNWEDAFQLTREANQAGPVADLVVFITDGDPTARNNPPGQPVTGLPEGEAYALQKAATQADLVKSQGSHIFAIGVGAAVTTPSSAARLTAISGPHQYPDTAFGSADYTLVTDFADLEASLRQIATELCQASVTLTKQVDEADGNGYRPEGGWTFTTSVDMSEGSYTWVLPTPPPSTGPTTATTNADGVATFQWNPSNADATSTATFNEALKPDYEFVDAVCTKSGSSQRLPVRLIRSAQQGSITLRPNEYGKCVVRNRRISGTLEVRKSLVPGTDGGRFNLLIDGTARATGVGDGGTTGQVVVPAGTRTVAESIAPSSPQVGLDDYVTDIACRSENGSGPVVASGSGAGPLNVPVAKDDDIVCTVTNQRRGVIQILKQAVPPGPQAFAFSGTLGDFSLADGSPLLPAQSTFTRLAPGNYAVTETEPAGWVLDGIACSGGTVQVSGTTATITLAPGGAVACVYRNSQTVDPPQPPPDPPAPPTPPPPVVPPTPPPPPTPARDAAAVSARDPGRREAGRLTPYDATAGREARPGGGPGGPDRDLRADRHQHRQGRGA